MKDAIAGFIGWLVIWCAVAVVACVPVGKLIARNTRPAPEPEPEGRDLSARPPFGAYADPDAAQNQRPSRYLPAPWQPSGDDLNDPREDRPRDSTPE